MDEAKREKGSQTSEERTSSQIVWTHVREIPKKDADFFKIFWILAFTFSVVAFLFLGFTASLVIISGAWAFFEYIKSKHGKEEKNEYRLTLKGFYFNNILIPYDKIERFNIVEHNGVKFLVLDVRNTILSDIAAPIEDEMEEDLYLYISQFVREDSDMSMPFVHLLAERLGL